MPNNVKFESVSSKGITFIDGYGSEVNIESLSDGYRSVLSMTLELIRQLVGCYKTADIFDEDNKTIVRPGVVFIDEVDVHLHPVWQRKIGNWLTTHFNKIQFIVTTHSPLICQSAANGSIWTLADAKSSQKGRRIEGVQYERLIYGNILEALSSGAFGPGIERSEAAQQLMGQLAKLNMKVQFNMPLSEDEQDERDKLQAIFGLTPNIVAEG